MCLKRLTTVSFGSSELFHLLRLMGVSVPSLHIESMIGVRMWPAVMMNIESLVEYDIHAWLHNGRSSQVISTASPILYFQT